MLLYSIRLAKVNQDDVTKFDIRAIIFIYSNLSFCKKKSVYFMLEVLQFGVRKMSVYSLVPAKEAPLELCLQSDKL